MKSLDAKLLAEINRYKNIVNYISEQEVDPTLPPPPGGDAALGGVPPPPGGDAALGGVPTTDTGVTGEPDIIDVEADDDVTKIDDKGDSQEGEESEELDVTDLVNSQKTIEDKQEEYFDHLFNQLSQLETKLASMDSVLSRLNNIETKIEKYREKTPEEKLELRSYDSYPFNQKLSDFFQDKQQDIQKTGKNEYVLTSDDVTDFNMPDIKKSFDPNYEDENNF
jgi:hypothetical protein